MGLHQSKKHLIHGQLNGIGNWPVPWILRSGRKNSMGILRTFGSKDKAPEYSSNIGMPVWSGLDESEFTPQIESKLSSFINAEAKRQGHNDSNQNRINENKSFFHPDFLKGWPQNLWEEKYDEGVYEHQNPKQEEPSPEFSDWDSYNEMIAEEFHEDNAEEIAPRDLESNKGHVSIRNVMVKASIENDDDDFLMDSAAGFSEYQLEGITCTPEEFVEWFLETTEGEHFITSVDDLIDLHGSSLDLSPGTKLSVDFDQYFDGWLDNRKKWLIDMLDKDCITAYEKLGINPADYQSQKDSDEYIKDTAFQGVDLDAILADLLEN